MGEALAGVQSTGKLTLWVPRHLPEVAHQENGFCSLEVAWQAPGGPLGSFPPKLLHGGAGMGMGLEIQKSERCLGSATAQLCDGSLPLSEPQFPHL